MIYITGNTRGLGESLGVYFQRSYLFDEIRGLNRPEYDFNDPWIPTDFSIFVNNAPCGFQQTELLYKLFEANKDRNCQIINICSVSADGDRKEVNEYAIQKKALDAACTQLQLVRSNCRVLCVKPGRMNTDLVSHIDAKKMDVYDVARQIVSFSEFSWGQTYIKTVTIDVKETL